MSVRAIEKRKYEEMCAKVSSYHVTSPAVNIMPAILAVLKRFNIHTILDAGVGPGKALRMLLDEGYEAYGVDITLAGLIDKSLKDKCFEATLWDLPTTKKYDFVMSVDVLEHIPPERLEKTIAELRRVTQRYALIQVAHFKERHGQQIGVQLHLSLFSAEEWKVKLKECYDGVVILDSDKGRTTFFCMVE